jgi:ABC-type Na+ efflux pump permease subunit
VACTYWIGNFGIETTVSAQTLVLDPEEISKQVEESLKEKKEKNIILSPIFMFFLLRYIIMFYVDFKLKLCIMKNVVFV